MATVFGSDCVECGATSVLVARVFSILCGYVQPVQCERARNIYERYNITGTSFGMAIFLYKSTPHEHSTNHFNIKACNEETTSQLRNRTGQPFTESKKECGSMLILICRQTKSHFDQLATHQKLNNLSKQTKTSGFKFFSFFFLSIFTLKTTFSNKFHNRFHSVVMKSAQKSTNFLQFRKKKRFVYSSINIT